jgi:V-type H+-transporting ATPase subunit E
LKYKIDLVNSLVEETKTALVEKIKDKKLYKDILTKLIIQGLIKLLETEVNIVCKKEDLELVKSILQDAKSQFVSLMKEQSVKFKNIDVNISVDEKYNLPDYIIGGVMMTAMKSKIRVDNTINKRLELLKQQAIPEIREKLFASN